MKDIPLRKDIAEEDRWDLSSLYKDDSEWEKDYQIVKEYLSTVEHDTDLIFSSAKNLKKYLDNFCKYDLIVINLYVYAYLKHTVDYSDIQSEDIHNRVQIIYSEFSSKNSFFHSLLNNLDNGEFYRLINNENLKNYIVYLKNIRRKKDHTLSIEGERVLSSSFSHIEEFQNIYFKTVNFDIKFPDVKDSNNNQYKLTEETYDTLTKSPDRGLRKNSFYAIYDEYEKRSNLFLSLYLGRVKADKFYSDSRRFNSTLEYGLYYDNASTDLVCGLIDSFRDNISSLHSYFAFIKRKSKLLDFSYYDLRVPLYNQQKVEITFDEAVNIITAALLPLGDEYVSVLEKGLKEERWCDKYSNQHKEKGAYHFGTYTSYPYIFMNYDPSNINSVFALAHECGHAMHRYFSNKEQSFINADHPALYGETPSLFNEMLVFHYMLNSKKYESIKEVILQEKLDEIFGYSFNQVSFVEFELKIHELIDKGEHVSSEYFKRIAKDIISFYYPNNIIKYDEKIENYFLRKPHIYRFLYVYKYVTGLSSAISIARKILKGDKNIKDSYLKFLALGETKYPLDALKDVGVDFSTKEPFINCIKEFDSTLEELKELI